MTNHCDVNHVCCVALELSQSSWVVAFAQSVASKVSVTKMAAGEVERLIGLLQGEQAKADR